MKYDVCAAVVSDLAYDARVWKQLRSLASAGYRVAVIGCRYDISERRTRVEDGVHIVEIPFGKRSGSVSHRARLVALVRLWLEVLRTRARVYHLHNIHPAPAVFTAALLRRATVVYDAHELYGEEGQAGAPGQVVAWLSLLLERLSVRRSGAVFTTNNSRANVLRERHGREDIGVLANVPNVVDPVVPLDPGFPRDRCVLLYQGGIYAERAFRETVHALKLLPNVHLAILGFGREREVQRIRAWAEEVGVADRVGFFGPRPFDELVGTAAAATVGLVPIKPRRLNHYLGDTNKLHEYLMAGLPVVATDIPEVRRVVRGGSIPIGELFDAESPASIAAAVDRVCRDRDEYERRRLEARRLALTKYNWEMEQERLLMTYEQLIGRPKELA